jgi:hypothetical protein
MGNLYLLALFIPERCNTFEPVGQALPEHLYAGGIFSFQLLYLAHYRQPAIQKSHSYCFNIVYYIYLLLLFYNEVEFFRFSACSLRINSDIYFFPVLFI